MDEHARGTLRFIKLLTELSFTSFQVTSQLGALSSLRVGVGQRPACTTEMGGMRPGGGEVALARSYMVGAELELESPGVLMPRPVSCISTLDKKHSQA